MKSVLFVCTANMCRSPVAAGLLKQKVQELGEADGWRIESAGVAALDGQSATPESVRVAAEHGVDLSDHRSRLATRERVAPFSLVLVMEQRHKDALQQAFPDLADRVELLSQMIGEGTDLADPVGTGIENYRAMADQIHSVLERGYERISTLASRDQPPTPAAIA